MNWDKLAGLRRCSRAYRSSIAGGVGSEQGFAFACMRSAAAPPRPPGQPSTWLPYELLVDCNGQALLFSDDPAVGVPADASSQLVRVRFQAARLDAAGNVDPATAGPWRDYAGSHLEVGLNRDRGDAFRFDLVLDTSSGQNPSVRELRVIFR